MAKSKKRGSSNQPKKHSIAPVSIAYKGKISLVIPLYNETNRLERLKQSLAAFEKQWPTPYEVVLVNDGSKDETLQQLNQLYGEASNEKVSYQIVDVQPNQGKGNALKQGVAKASGDHILTLDADMAAHPQSLLKWLKSLPNNTFPEDKILIASREHPNSKIKALKERRNLGLIFNFFTRFFTSLDIKDTQCGFKLYPKAIAKFLFANMRTKGWAHDIELLYQADLAGIEIEEMPIDWEEVDNSKINVYADGIKMAITTFLIAINLRFRHFFVAPFREASAQNPIKQLQKSKESPFFRFSFAILSILLVFLMPMLSFDYGITGDEHLHLEYGNRLLEYYQTDGIKDAFFYDKNLFYYGGIFDYNASRIHDLAGFEDPYHTRHFLNALVGVFMMIFIGLTAKLASGRWSVGFLALLFAMLSPRLFGHAMNNPKDIPFAAAYIFTVYTIIKFVKDLPNPSFKRAFLVALGIGLAINMRIGGLLLIGYFGLFTGIAFLAKRNLRAHLTNIKTLGKIAAIGVITSGLGFWLGMWYWPYGAEAPIEHSMRTLKEMSNFSIGIRILFDGNNIWSDSVPWSYIPTWFWYTAPLFILIGSILWPVMAIINRKREELLAMGLVLFAGVFPVAYAIYQDSALYDGMRHFLFAYTLFPILAAWSWERLARIHENPWVARGVSGVVGVLMALPVLFMVSSHPYQYTYFNEIKGGIGAAYGEFETDYWMTSMKGCSDWLVENEPKIKAGERVVIRTNCYSSVKHYFAKYENVVVDFVKFHERVKEPWDYGLFISRHINHKFLKRGVWPTNNVVHAEKVSNVPIGVVVKSPTGNIEGPAAVQAMKNKDANTAIAQLQTVINRDSLDESAMLYLSQCAGNAKQFDLMKQNLDKILNFSDQYSNALGLVGIYYLNVNDGPNAEKYLLAAIEHNYRYTPAYFYLARMLKDSDPQRALGYLEALDLYGGKPTQAYALAEEIAKKINDNQRYLYFRTQNLRHNAKTQKDHQTAYATLQQCIGLTTKYEPADKLYDSYQEAEKNRVKREAREARKRKIDPTYGQTKK